MAWSIQGAGTTEALVMNYGTTPTDLSYINFINNINAYFEGNINLTNYDGTDGASLAAALEGKSVLLVPTQQQFLTTPGVLADMGDVMDFLTIPYLAALAKKLLIPTPTLAQV